MAVIEIDVDSKTVRNEHKFNVFCATLGEALGFWSWCSICSIQEARDYKIDEQGDRSLWHPSTANMVCL